LRPGKKGSICSKVFWWVKYWMRGAKAGGSETTSFSRKMDRSMKRLAMGGTPDARTVRPPPS
jgi:hypothetical protein